MEKKMYKCTSDVIVHGEDRAAFKAGKVYRVKKVDGEDEALGPYFTMTDSVFPFCKRRLSKGIIEQKFVEV